MPRPTFSLRPSAFLALVACALLASCDDGSKNGSGTICGGAAGCGSVAEYDLPAPVLTPGTGTYDGPQKVVITCDVPGSQIRYTRDGTVPTAASMLYSDTLLVSTSGAIHAKAFHQGKESPLSIGAYGIKNP
ncbi:MAG: hypothetical protein RL318_1510 [Fibrobacterota bacterium]|jgi:hypothetical protein